MCAAGFSCSRTVVGGSLLSRILFRPIGYTNSFVLFLFSGSNARTPNSTDVCSGLQLQPDRRRWISVEPNIVQAYWGLKVCSPELGVFGDCSLGLAVPSAAPLRQYSAPCAWLGHIRYTNSFVLFLFSGSNARTPNSTDVCSGLQLQPDRRRWISVEPNIVQAYWGLKVCSPELGVFGDCSLGLAVPSAAPLRQYSAPCAWLGHIRTPNSTDVCSGLQLQPDRRRWISVEPNIVQAYWGLKVCSPELGVFGDCSLGLAVPSAAPLRQYSAPCARLGHIRAQNARTPNSTDVCSGLQLQPDRRRWISVEPNIVQAYWGLKVCSPELGVFGDCSLGLAVPSAAPLRQYSAPCAWLGHIRYTNSFVLFLFSGSNARTPNSTDVCSGLQLQPDRRRWISVEPNIVQAYWGLKVCSPELGVFGDCSLGLAVPSAAPLRQYSAPCAWLGHIRYTNSFVLFLFSGSNARTPNSTDVCSGLQLQPDRRRWISVEPNIVQAYWGLKVCSPELGVFGDCSLGLAVPSAAPLRQYSAPCAWLGHIRTPNSTDVCSGLQLQPDRRRWISVEPNIVQAYWGLKVCSPELGVFGDCSLGLAVPSAAPLRQYSAPCAWLGHIRFVLFLFSGSNARTPNSTDVCSGLQLQPDRRRWISVEPNIVQAYWGLKVCSPELGVFGDCSLGLAVPSAAPLRQYSAPCAWLGHIRSTLGRRIARMVQRASAAAGPSSVISVEPNIVQAYWGPTRTPNSTDVQRASAAADRRRWISVEPNIVQAYWGLKVCSPELGVFGDCSWGSLCLLLHLYVNIVPPAPARAHSVRSNARAPNSTDVCSGLQLQPDRRRWISVEPNIVQAYWGLKVCSPELGVFGDCSLGLAVPSAAPLRSNARTPNSTDVCSGLQLQPDRRRWISVEPNIVQAYWGLKVCSPELGVFGDCSLGLAVPSAAPLRQYSAPCAG
ncbi:UNVERIFIED_CONTAM: hypothetical protein PYX00_005459 [Menopon gallinae]|uniref:Uncharacterized protein n=1 Tax=Menopon gallinae TaxID=328185 RepID=A0AAW2HT51_9NEOP